MFLAEVAAEVADLGVAALQEARRSHSMALVTASMAMNAALTTDSMATMPRIDTRTWRFTPASAPAGPRYGLPLAPDQAACRA
jgi:hypothetical protein